MLQLLFGCESCQTCCKTNEVEVTENQILKEVLGNEGDDDYEAMLSPREEVVIYTTEDFSDGFSKIAKPVLLGTSGREEMKNLRAAKLLNSERRGGTPTSSTRGDSQKSVQLSSEALLSPMSCRMSTPRSTSSGKAELPITSYRLNEDDPECQLSRHVAFAPSRQHSVHQSEHSVTPYGEVYGQHPATFNFDDEGNMVDCDPELQPAKEEKCISRREQFKNMHNSGASGSICFD
mmetsp:Transcript_109783/g.199926  ORF Transcript_109783/g.199926 Transcript_109783/m.199926 type:complete len:234 (+) Transcript_109783:103-804(+)